MRKWAVTIVGLKHIEIKEDLITLTKLKNTIKELRTKGPNFSNNRWGAPIVPLLVEHIFLKNSASLDDVVSFTLNIRENKDTEVC